MTRSPGDSFRLVGLRSCSSSFHLPPGALSALLTDLACRLEASANGVSTLGKRYRRSLGKRFPGLEMSSGWGLSPRRSPPLASALPAMLQLLTRDRTSPGRAGGSQESGKDAPSFGERPPRLSTRGLIHGHSRERGRNLRIYPPQVCDGPGRRARLGPAALPASGVSCALFKPWHQP